jgi:deoxyadenosine/deoxycytidine kinase
MSASESISPRIYVVEGNIAAGKSTLCKNLEEKMNAKAFFEPVEENPFLTCFYENPREWAFQLQVWFLNKRMQLYVEALRYSMRNNTTVIIDRSILGDYAFGLANYDSGNMDNADFYAYQALWESGLALMRRFPPTCIIYLQVAPLECQRRITDLRKRSCEMGIPLSYLQKLDSTYKRVLHWALSDSSNLAKSIHFVDWNSFGLRDNTLEKTISLLESSKDPPLFIPSPEDAIHLIST